MSTPSDSGYGAAGEDQLQESDTLENRGVDDVLDEGYSPPEKWSAAEKFGTTADEVVEGEPLDEKLAEEEPEPDPYEQAEREDAEETRTGDEYGDAETGGERAGRLAAYDPATPEGEVPGDAGEEAQPDSDVLADDVGIDGSAAGAEEAAMHVIDDE